MDGSVLRMSLTSEVQLGNGTCSTGNLDNPGRDDFMTGNLDLFTGPGILGTCHEYIVLGKQV